MSEAKKLIDTLIYTFDDMGLKHKNSGLTITLGEATLIQDAIDQLETENKSLKKAENHYPECKFWKWDWRFSWDKTDCSCPLD